MARLSSDPNSPHPAPFETLDTLPAGVLTDPDYWSTDKTQGALRSHSFAVAIDKRTGENRWRVDRPRAINWVTPIVIKNGELLPGWTGPEGVLRARQRHAETMKELPAVVNRLQRGEAAIPTIYEEN